MTQAQRNEAIAKLVAAGWRRLYSVMHDGDKSNLKYGSVYVTVGGLFYLNDKTFSKLPV